ncbi:MAG TPA: sugar phosphate isomerase/epimerase [Verrucomicrobia bacterium]|nr:sugar phosphate isomerase/epimerase [Verrucomicrobiota bacterium]
MAPMKFGICNEIFEGWTMEDTMAYAAKTGYDCLEIAPFTISNYVTDISAAERQRVKDLAAKTGIEISGIHWVLVKAEGMHMTHTDASIREKTAKYFVELVDCCADFGGESIIVGSPYQRNLMDGVSYEQAWEWATEVFKDSVAHAAERGVTICFEPLAPSETNFVNTHTEAIKFTQQFDNPNFKIILDTKAMCSMGKPIPEIIRESKGEFAYYHANDENLKGPGFGEVDFVPIGEALRDVGYDGVVSVEVFDFEEGPEVIATQSLANLKEAFGV